MSDSTQSALREAYTDALERGLAQSLETKEDWSRYHTMVATKLERLDAEKLDYQQNYLTRLADARQIILREEHSVSLDQPLPPGVDRQSDTQGLDIKADARVRQDHERRITVIVDDHRSDLEALGAEISARSPQQDTPDLQQDWNRSVRRSVPTQT